MAGIYDRFFIPSFCIPGFLEVVLIKEPKQSCPYQILNLMHYQYPEIRMVNVHVPTVRIQTILVYEERNW